MITLARQQLADATIQRDFINLIETIIVYKLPQKSREEIAAMLNLSELKQTRFYQEVKQEGVEEGREVGERQAKVDAIPRMMTFGLNAETIAQLLDLPLDFVVQTITQIERQSMSFPEQSIDTFIELLTQQRTLFSPEQLTELEQIVEPLDDDIDILSKAISSWSENYPEIEAAKFKLLEVVGSQSSEKAPESKQGKVPKSKSNLNKKTLRNAIEQGSKPAESQSSTDDAPEKE